MQPTSYTGIDRPESQSREGAASEEGGCKKLKEAQCLQKAPVGSSTEADPARSRGVPEPWRSLNNLCINRTAMSKIHTVMCVAMQPHLKLQGIRLYRSAGETEMIKDDIWDLGGPPQGSGFWVPPQIIWDPKPKPR